MKASSSCTLSMHRDAGDGAGGRRGRGNRRREMMRVVPTQDLHQQQSTPVTSTTTANPTTTRQTTRSIMIFILIVAYQFMTMFNINQRFQHKLEDWSIPSVSTTTTATTASRKLDQMIDEERGGGSSSGRRSTIARVDDSIPRPQSPGSSSLSSLLPSRSRLATDGRNSSSRWRTMLQQKQQQVDVDPDMTATETKTTTTTSTAKDTPVIDAKTTKEKNQSRRRRPKKNNVRVIYGIVSHDLDVNEIRRRNLIRRTFLKYFHDYPVSKVMKDLNITTTKNTTVSNSGGEGGSDYNDIEDDDEEEKKYWICSLNDLDQGKLEYPEKCRFAYAFIIGGRGNTGEENIPTMLLDFNESYPISLPPPPKATKSDRQDCVYLNIIENGKFGKSPTWFRYVVDVLDRHPEWNDEHGNSFEYIWKSDTDNLLYTPEFFRYIDRKLPRKKNSTDDKVLVYGGRPLDYEGCGGDTHDHCSQLVGPNFMAGGGYFLSIDLARFVTNSSAFDHYAVKLPHEDMTTGNFVYSYPNATSEIKLVTEQRHKGVIRKHPVKGNKKWKKWWKLMLKQEQNKLLKKYYHENEEASRVIVLVSLGDEIAQSNLIERLVWSARNRANYHGWIVVLSDAPTGRYTDNLGHLPKVLEVPIKPEHYMVTTTLSPNRREMMVQRLKTHVLDYIVDDRRFDEVQSIYVMETDMVFGSEVRPLFTEWEELYSISRSSTGIMDGNDSDDTVDESLDGDDDKPTSQSSIGHHQQVMKDSSPPSPISKIWFFGGSHKTNTPSGQFIIDRDSSQYCLERWRYWIDRDGSTSSSETQDDSSSNKLFEFLNSTDGRLKSASNSSSCYVIDIPEDERKVYTPSDEDIIIRVNKLNGTDQVEVDNDIPSTSDGISTEMTTKNKRKKSRRRQNYNHFPPLVHVRSVASATRSAVAVDPTIHETFLVGLLNLNPKRKRSKKMLLAKPTIIHLK